MRPRGDKWASLAESIGWFAPNGRWVGYIKNFRNRSETEWCQEFDLCLCHGTKCVNIAWKNFRHHPASLSFYYSPPGLIEPPTLCSSNYTDVCMLKYVYKNNRWEFVISREREPKMRPGVQSEYGTIRQRPGLDQAPKLWTKKTLWMKKRRHTTDVFLGNRGSRKIR